MNDPAPKPIADCPNPDCRRPCSVNSYEDSDAWDVFVDCCTKDFAGCGYSGPRIDAAQYGLGFAKAKAIRLHNLLCRPNPETQAVAPNITLKQLVDKFLSWPLPESVCPDLCTNVTKDTYPGHRIGTQLLTAIEAEEMIKYLGLYPCPCHPAIKQTMRSHEVELRCSHLNGCQNIMDELKEHTNAAQGEDAYLRIYPCDARKILEPVSRSPVEAVPVSALRELEAEFRDDVDRLTEAGSAADGAVSWCADRLSAVIRGTKT